MIGGAVPPAPGCAPARPAPNVRKRQSITFGRRGTFTAWATQLQNAGKQASCAHQDDLRGNARRPIIQKVVPHYCPRSFPCQRC